MLFHASFPAADPARAAEAVAKLWRGVSYPFPVFPGSHIALQGDRKGTSIEFYPSGQVLVPGNDEVAHATPRPGGPSETHLAISTDLGEKQVKTIASQYGWMARTCSRGGKFRVIEFWVENTFLIEVLTPEMQAEYLAFMTPKNYSAFLKEVTAAEAA